MEQIIEKIKKIERSRTALRQAIADNELATSPKLKDLSLIPKIYEVFEAMKGQHITANDRKQFIFVVIYLYLPSKFFGGKMPHGLRRAIVRATNATYASFISATCTELMILYTAYQDFREEVDELMSAVINMLEKDKGQH